MAQSIGTRFESSLHHALKLHYVGRGGKVEVDLDGFVIDGITASGEFIEIQTGHFGAIRHKIKALAKRGTVRVVYPIIVTKYITVCDIDGAQVSRRKSPLKGSFWSIFDVLVHAPELPLIPHVHIELALIDADEYRVRDGKGAWRRKGISITDRRLLALHQCITLRTRVDYRRFLPFAKTDSFTAADLKDAAGIPIDQARKALYVLTKLKLVRRVGKQRNTLVYQIIPARTASKPAL